MAGIILTSSILDSQGIYAKARQILLRHFDIKGIVELNEKTFAYTGTRTIVLFLKRVRDDRWCKAESEAKKISQATDCLEMQEYLERHRQV